MTVEQVVGKNNMAVAQNKSKKFFFISYSPIKFAYLKKTGRNQGGLFCPVRFGDENGPYLILVRIVFSIVHLLLLRYRVRCCP
jgi:hypothetical protein